MLTDYNLAVTSKFTFVTVSFRSPCELWHSNTTRCSTEQETCLHWGQFV